MPDLLTPERLAEIRERLSKATPGPCCAVFWDKSVAGPDGHTYWSVECNEPAVLQVAACTGGYGHPGEAEGDAKFLAACYTDVPALLSHIDAMREVLEAVEYSGQPDNTCFSSCPVCGAEGDGPFMDKDGVQRWGAEPIVHAPDCRLAAALGKGGG